MDPAQDGSLVVGRAPAVELAVLPSELELISKSVKILLGQCRGSLNALCVVAWIQLLLLFVSFSSPSVQIMG